MPQDVGILSVRYQPTPKLEVQQTNCVAVGWAVKKPVLRNAESPFKRGLRPEGGNKS